MPKRGCRVVCVACVVFARYGHPLRYYITHHRPQCPPVTALERRLVPVPSDASEQLAPCKKIQGTVTDCGSPSLNDFR